MISRPLLGKAVYAQLMFQLMGTDEEKMERMRAEAARTTEGWEVDKIKSVVSEVLEDIISPLIFAEALELLHDHHAAGRLVCIVSSSPEEIVEPLARMLRINHYILHENSDSRRQVHGRARLLCLWTQQDHGHEGTGGGARHRSG